MWARGMLRLAAVNVDGELATFGDAHLADYLRRYIRHKESGVV